MHAAGFHLRPTSGEVGCILAVPSAYSRRGMEGSRGGILQTVEAIED